jgi:hypothetical protein
VGPFDHKVKEGLQLGVTETGSRSGSPFGEKKEKLIEVLRGYVLYGRVAKQGFQVSKQITVASPGFVSHAVFLMVFE